MTAYEAKRTVWTAKHTSPNPVKPNLAAVTLKRQLIGDFARARSVVCIKTVNYCFGGWLQWVTHRLGVPPAKHAYKYRAVYVANGERVVGFDNERGKGDHCHLDGKERPYRFTTVEQLVEDFIAAVAARRAI